LKSVTLEIPWNVCRRHRSQRVGQVEPRHGNPLPILSRKFLQVEGRPLPYGSIEGLKQIDKVIEIDQSPIGPHTEVEPATYTGSLRSFAISMRSFPKQRSGGTRSADSASMSRGKMR